MTDYTVVVCPGCLQKYRVSAERVGRRATCKKCGEQFRISAEPPIDDDTIFGWVTGDDPGGSSVMGGTGIFAPSKIEPPPQSERWRRPHPPAEARIKFDRIDEIGAYFEFPCYLLEDSSLRASFPHRCVHCLSGDNLSVHFLIWGDKLPRSDALRVNEAENRAVRRLDELIRRDPADWFDRLEAIAVLPPPFSNPLPYYVCDQCSAIGEVVCHVLNREGMEQCQVAIANLAIAVEFYRNNGGRAEAGFRQLVIASRQQKDDQWRRLPFAVRAKISQWFTLEDEETFLGYYADEDFSRSETGSAGLVLTNRRMVYKKYASHREYALEKGGKLLIETDRASAMVDISQEGTRDAVLTVKPPVASGLARVLGDHAESWEIKFHSVKS